MTEIERMKQRKQEAENMASKMRDKGEVDLAIYWNNVAKCRAEKLKAMEMEGGEK